MNTPNLNSAVTREQARAALIEYKQHRSSYDALDHEIEKIYRAIARGKVVISVSDSIVKAGVDEHGFPRLAVSRADCQVVIYTAHGGRITFKAQYSEGSKWGVVVPRAIDGLKEGWNPAARARVPRIPPQFRPRNLRCYWLLWEADWQELPRDPMLLRKIGRDAYVVLAAWDLTDVELSVLRAHGGSQ